MATRKPPIDSGPRMLYERPTPVFNAEFRQLVKNIMNTISPTSSHLEKAFNELLAGQEMTLQLSDFEEILKDFGILAGDLLNDRDVRGFVQILIYYVGCWPEWKDKQSTFYNLNAASYSPENDDDIVFEGVGEETKKNWFKEFYAYLYLKMKYAMTIDGLRPPSPSNVTTNEVETQTEYNPKNPNSRYAIIIEGPPSCLNAIAFTSTGDDIHIRQHADKPWDTSRLTMKQFLNCPYVKVNFEIGDISFSRSNVHDFERYISKVNSPVTLGTNENVVSTSKMDAELPCNIFTRYFFVKYFEQFLRMLESEKSLLEAKKAEISIIIEEFLADIEEITLNNKIMGTNLSLSFMIGNAKYIRSKQMTQLGIHYLEILTPQVLLSLKYFRAEQDSGDTSNISFNSLNALENNPEQFLKVINNGCISYSCNLCCTVYSSYANIGQHFNEQHRQEQDVICSICRRTVEIYTLAGTRWVHDCKK